MKSATRKPEGPHSYALHARSPPCLGRSQSLVGLESPTHTGHSTRSRRSMIDYAPQRLQAASFPQETQQGRPSECGASAPANAALRRAAEGTRLGRPGSSEPSGPRRRILLRGSPERTRRFLFPLAISAPRLKFRPGFAITAKFGRSSDYAAAFSIISMSFCG